MFSRAELKNGAKDQLRGKWLLAVLVFLCYSVNKYRSYKFNGRINAWYIFKYSRVISFWIY